MSPPIDSSPTSSASPIWQFVWRNFSVFLFLLLAPVGMLVVYWYFNPAGAVSAESFAMAVQASTTRSAAITKPVSERIMRQRFTQSPPPFSIGIIVGHRGSDSGAVCDDGLTELAINTTIAEKVATQLTTAGYNVSLLDEFDTQLDNYQGVALVSIHADSCGDFGPTTTGYKMAATSRTDSSALLNCLDQNYAEATGLTVHENTITTHMTDYHAFRKIAEGTPAVIVETGFMNLDRNLLTVNSDIPARAIAAGIICYAQTQR